MPHCKYCINIINIINHCNFRIFHSVFGALEALDPKALCFYDAGEFPGCSGLVALTLDDAPCRGETSMLCEIKVGIGGIGGIGGMWVAR